MARKPTKAAFSQWQNRMSERLHAEARKPTDTVQLKLRFSEALRRRLVRSAKKVQSAKKQNWSLNAEIVFRLEESLDSESLYDTAPLSTVMAKTLFKGLDEEVLRQLCKLFLEHMEVNEVNRLVLDRAKSERFQK